MRVPGPILALARDLIFISKIGEAARGLGRAVVFVSDLGAFSARLSDKPGLVLLDLTTPGLDLDAAIRAFEAEGRPAPLVAWTTHALWTATAPLHPRCDRVMTREALAQELPALFRENLGGGEEER